MSNTVKAAIITGVFSLLAGVIGTLGMSSVFNQNITVNLNGEAVTVTPEKYRTLIDENERLKSELKESDLNSKAQSKPVDDGKSNYLVYKIEPYSSSMGFKKIIDESMKMGGNKYNNGFKLGYALGDEFATYNFDGKYTELSGLIGFEDPGSGDDATVEFWGDDVLLASQVVKSRDLPREFSVDLTGIRKFEIRIDERIRYSVNFAEVKLK